MEDWFENIQEIGFIQGRLCFLFTCLLQRIACDSLKQPCPHKNVCCGMAQLLALILFQCF